RRMSGNNFPLSQQPSTPIDPFDDSATVETSQNTDILSVPQAAVIPSFRPSFSQGDHTSFDPNFNDNIEDYGEQDPLYSDSTRLIQRQITNMSYSEANLPLTSDSKTETSDLPSSNDVSPTNQYTTLGTLMVVLTATACKEILEDYKRHRSDSEVNQRKCKYFELTGETYVEKEWNRVTVGDIVRVESGEFFPADLILLSSSEPEGLCYIETSNLDGETNLKIKQATSDTSHLISPSETSRLRGYIKSEKPNDSLYTYDGVLVMDTPHGQKQIPLDPTQLLLRVRIPRSLTIIYFPGAQLRNTSWIYGIVVFTGHETKLMKNATLIVTMEVVKFQQALLINDDLDMYYEKTDTPALCRTSSLVEELGQIEYIFSDKTGTLTCNEMEFKQCSIAGLA
ncbi:1028_t:CDS:2, partial [Cetraspora pellucida]